MQIDHTVLLTCAQHQKACFALISDHEDYACEFLNPELTHTQCHEKLKLIQKVIPHAIAIGMIYCGYGLDINKINFPKFGDFVLLINFSFNELSFKVFKTKPNLQNCKLKIKPNKSLANVLKKTVSVDLEVKNKLLLAKIKKLREDVEKGGDFEKYAQLRKISLINGTNYWDQLTRLFDDA